MQVIVVPGQLSVAVGLKETGVPAGPEHSATIGPGQLIEGGSISFTTTGNVHYVVPFLFETVHVTIFVPTKKVLPERGSQVTTGGGEPLGVGAKKTTAEH
jgi:hypothetical protein